MARITLWGFYQWTDKKLFDNIQLDDRLDKQILIDLIMQQSGELFPFHQQPDYLKHNIENWFARMKSQFSRMYDAITAEYNPIENYDRIEEWSDSESISASTSESSSASSHDSSSDSSSNSMTNDVSAANMTTGFLPDSASKGESVGKSSSDSKNEIKRHNIENRQHYSEHSGRIHGNIGVLTNQSMVTAELELRKFDLYQTIANMFEEQFIVRKYT